MTKNYLQHLIFLHDNGDISDEELDEGFKDCGYDDYIFFLEKIKDRMNNA